MMETKSLLLVVLIAALLVTVGLQTVQLVGLSGSNSGSAVVVKSSSSSSLAKAGGSGSAASAGGSLNNLPSMVGGC